MVFLNCFYFVVTDHPSDNKWLTREELRFLESSHGETARKRVSKGAAAHSQAIPFRNSRQSHGSPFSLLLLYMHASSVVSRFHSLPQSISTSYHPISKLLSQETPRNLCLFQEELSLPLSSNGLYTMVPFLCQLFFKNLFAYIADNLKRSGHLTPTQTVKAFQALGESFHLFC